MSAIQSGHYFDTHIVNCQPQDLFLHIPASLECYKRHFEVSASHVAFMNIAVVVALVLLPAVFYITLLLFPFKNQ